MTGDHWLDRLELSLARTFPARGRHLRTRVDDRRLARAIRSRERAGRALEGGNGW